MPPGPFAPALTFLEKGAVLPRGPASATPGGAGGGGRAPGGSGPHAAGGGHVAKHKRKARGAEIVFDPDACR